MFGEGTKSIAVLNVTTEEDLTTRVRESIASALVGSRVVRANGTTYRGSEEGLPVIAGKLIFTEQGRPFVVTPAGRLGYDMLWSGPDLCGGCFRAYDVLQLGKYVIESVQNQQH